VDPLFAPLPALAGGVLIGLAAVLLLVATGRVAGVSGIVGSLVRPGREDRAWRIAFVAGLGLGALCYSVVRGEPIAIEIDVKLPTLIVAGLLVGFGTTMANGCTSGHGVCGISRLSPRSMMATGVFMATGGATVLLTRHVL
jgi:uncharacterized membrane protein YedE/YeeE